MARKPLKNRIIDFKRLKPYHVIKTDNQNEFVLFQLMM